MTRRILWTTAWSVGLVLLCGCGGAASSSISTQNDLKAFALGYHDFYDKNKRGPKDANELHAHVEKFDKTGAKALKEGNYVIIYNVSIPDMIPTSDYILAYHKDVPENGGAVVMGDGTIKLLSATEFKNAKLAKPRSQ